MYSDTYSITAIMYTLTTLLHICVLH